MEDAMLRLAELAPVAMSVLFMFVLIVAGSTIGYLIWRAYSERSGFPRV
jgi:uncharacterized membrane protein (DUF4010 family)